MAILLVVYEYEPCSHQHLSSHGFEVVLRSTTLGSALEYTVIYHFQVFSIQATMNVNGQPFERATDGDASAAHGNPMKKAFDDFRRSAPIVTQSIMMMTIGSWMLNLLLPKHVLECIPYLIVQKFEVYRVLTSILVNPDLFSNLFACLMLAQHFRIVEESVGSAATLWLVLGVFTIIVNIAYCIIQMAKAGSSSVDGASIENTTAPMFWETPGIWTALMGIIAVEACRASQFQQQRSFCNCFNIPTKLYPLCLLLIVSFMKARSGITLVASTGLGYLIGLDLDSGLLAIPAIVATSFDSNFRGTQGWICANASIGPEAWMQEREVCIFQSVQDRDRLMPMVAIVASLLRAAFFSRFIEAIGDTTDPGNFADSVGYLRTCTWWRKST